MKKNAVKLIIISLALVASLFFVACGAASDNSMEGGKLDAAPPSNSGSGIDLELNGSIPKPDELSEEQLAHWKALAELAEK